MPSWDHNFKVQSWLHKCIWTASDPASLLHASQRTALTVPWATFHAPEWQLLMCRTHKTFFPPSSQPENPFINADLHRFSCKASSLFYWLASSILSFSSHCFGKELRFVVWAWPEREGSSLQLTPFSLQDSDQIPSFQKELSWPRNLNQTHTHHLRYLFLSVSMSGECWSFAFIELCIVVCYLLMK